MFSLDDLTPETVTVARAREVIGRLRVLARTKHDAGAGSKNNVTPCFCGSRCATESALCVDLATLAQGGAAEPWLARARALYEALATPEDRARRAAAAEKRARRAGRTP